ncbi:alpha/beta fold hydrolase, partial [Beijerinckia sp. L45]|uniref:alpha/beta fold hydrolase n=1 Tax=Beijerinckia sp. L45 TaxID=1641855 RepID=UPI00131E368B
MIGKSAARDEPPLETTSDAARVQGAPCVFKGCRGAFHAGVGPVGVVLCAPWGFEDLSMRKSWRLLAEAIAAAGFPVLRFDYPGTGNSLGAMTDIADAAQWTSAIGDAADFLRAYSGVKKYVFIGQSLGAALATAAAGARSDVAALLLIAPVVKGRAYVRELAVTSSLVADKLGITVDLAPGEGLSVLGFSLSQSMVDSLKALDLTKTAIGGVQTVVVYDQADRKQGAEVSEHFRRNGVAARLETIAPYHLMISDATEIQPLPASPAQIVAALLALYPASAQAVTPRLPLLPATLRAETFREEPLRFGIDGAMHGTLCQPVHPHAGSPVIIFLNRGLNAQIGWRRVSVDHARALAGAGISSLRIDLAGLGESVDHPGRPVPLIYSDELVADVSAAIDALAARGHARIALVGVCSGAYTALAVAEVDPRVTDLVVVNTQRLVWNPAENVEDVIRYGLRSVSDYVGDIKSRNALRKLIRSRRRILPALWFLAKRGVGDAVARLPLSWRSALLRESMAGRVQRLFAGLSARGTRVSLVYSDTDPGL